MGEPDEVPDADVSNVVLLSPEERKRERDRNRRTRDVRSKTIAVKRMLKGERDRFHLELLREGIDVDRELADRPRTRAECVDGIRPCPYVGCRYHIALDVSPRTGSMCFTKPDVEVQDYPPGETCALDVADQGPQILERVGELLNVTRERVRQIEEIARASFIREAGPSLAGDLRDSLADALNQPGDTRSEAAEDPGNHQGAGREKRRDRRADNIGLSRADRNDVERYTNEVTSLMRTWRHESGMLCYGLSLEAAQALASEDVEGPEDRPQSLVPVDWSRPNDEPANPGSPEPCAASPGEEEREMRGVSEEKANRLEARSLEVLAYLKKHGPSGGPAIREAVPDANPLFLRNMVGAGEIKSMGSRNTCRYFLPGQEDITCRPTPRAPGPKRASAPPPPRPGTALVKLAKNSTYGTDVDPVEMLRGARAKVLEDARQKAEKIDAAIEALGGEVEGPR